MFLSPSNADPGANVTVSKEEFNAFHNIDRMLFTRLVMSLGRDTSQSTHVMAFIMWLEKKTKDFRMISNILQWPNEMLNDLAEEANMVLNCVESPKFPEGVDKFGNLILIQKITRNPMMSLKYFYDNRMEVIFTVTKLLNCVCTKAFIDIVQRDQYEKLMQQQSLVVPNIIVIRNPYAQMQPLLSHVPTPGFVVLPQPIAVPVSQWNEGSSSTWVGSGSNIYDVAERKAFNEEFNEMLANLQLKNPLDIAADEGKKVAPDDRTVFMTFSNGYSISENEIRNFFTSLYGDVIEAIFMQDVPPPKQPLFARLVFLPNALEVIDSFLEGTRKVKISINGKHAWARKYVRKGGKST